MFFFLIIQTVRIILDLSCLADAAHRLGDCAELLRDRACLAIMTIFYGNNDLRMLRLV